MKTLAFFADRHSGTEHEQPVAYSSHPAMPVRHTTHPPTHPGSRRSHLLRDIGVVLVVKLLVLTVLWWAFVRDQRVEVQAEQPALPWLAADTPSAESKPHDQ
jgi:hypothetical protein